MAGKCLADQAQAADIQFWLCKVGAVMQPATIAKHRDQLLAGRIDITMIHWQVCIAPGLKRG